MFLPVSGLTRRSLYYLHGRFATIQFRRTATATEERILAGIRAALDRIETAGIARGTGPLADACRASLR